MTTSWWTKILDLISPRCCVVCGQRLAPAERSLCSSCMLHLPRTAYQFSPGDNAMAQLFWHLTPIERAAALIFYEPHSPTARIVYKLKYGDRPDIGEDMGRLMAREMQQAHYLDDIDVLLPVPLAPKRMRQRGYNQSQQLALGISDITGLPIVSGVLQRRLFVQSQTKLGRQERQANVAQQFTVQHASRLEGKHALLIDDVCTTGATLTACAEALRPIPHLRLSVLTFGFTKS